LVIALNSLYCWTATSNNGTNVDPEYLSYTSFLPSKQYKDYYNLLTENLVNGKLYLKQEVPSKLLSLKNPYDPVERNKLS